MTFGTSLVNIVNSCFSYTRNFKCLLQITVKVTLTQSQFFSTVAVIRSQK